MVKRNVVLSLVLFLVLLLVLALARSANGFVAGETVKITALSAVATGTSSVFALNQYDRVGLAVKWATGVTAGVVKLETAATSSDADTWNEVLALNVTAAPTPPCTTADGADVVAQYGRVRISTTISGGGSPSATAYVFLRKTGN